MRLGLPNVRVSKSGSLGGVSISKPRERRARKTRPLLAAPRQTAWNKTRGRSDVSSNKDM